MTAIREPRYAGKYA